MTQRESPVRLISLAVPTPLASTSERTGESAVALYPPSAKKTVAAITKKLAAAVTTRNRSVMSMQDSPDAEVTVERYQPRLTRTLQNTAGKRHVPAPGNSIEDA